MTWWYRMTYVVQNDIFWVQDDIFNISAGSRMTYVVQNDIFSGSRMTYYLYIYIYI